MGTMIFFLPANLAGPLAREIERASVAGGPDQMPYATQVNFNSGRLVLSRSVQDSGYLLVPWEVTGFGRMIFGSATLIERSTPYPMLLELARGKINRLRCQAADWLLGGLIMSPDLAERIHAATLSFGQVLQKENPVDVERQAQETLLRGCQASEELVATYNHQVFQVRHARQARLDSILGCRLNGLPQRSDLQKLLPLAFNAIGAHVTWRTLEPNENDFRWQALDEIITWGQGQGINLVGGPLVDFSGFGIPDWLWAKDADLTRLGEFLCRFVDRVVRRYKGKINVWQITAGSNMGGVLALAEEELLWLTIRLLQTARQADPNLELIAGLAQPWGDYLALKEHSHSPFAFADSLLRTGIKLAALDLEIIMGPTPRGSYCRDTLDASRLLDLYSYLGVPLQVTLGYPSSATPDPLADPDLALGGGFWHTGFSPESQADWATTFTSLALCKPAVRSVFWAHLNDAVPHQFPHSGLVDSQGNLKPALERLFALRGEHLK